MPEKPVLRRVENYEQKNSFFSNLFYCFFYPYVCRLQPITDEDIPDVSYEDSTKVTTEKLVKEWNGQLSEYYRRCAEYDKGKKDSNLFVFHF